jgi:predicted phosphohydrolase
MTTNNSKMVWATDLHLNMLKPFDLRLRAFATKILSHKPTIVVITGDISEAETIEEHLLALEKELKGIEILFNLGNHDFYGGSIKHTRELIKSTFSPSSTTRYLPGCGVITLSENAGRTALIGHDGWYDGDYPYVGAFHKSALDMNDFFCIKELNPSYRKTSDRAFIYKEIQRLSKEGADYFETYLTEALKTHNKVYLATHVPPFQENSRGPDGKISGIDWMPCFSSRVIGEKLIEIMTRSENLNKELIVLCGHTHTYWLSKPTANVTCITGRARYGYPEVTRTINY